MSYTARMDRNLYSVKEVAALIARGPADQSSKLIRQIRHWTTSDLLAPVGGKETGTGVSRMYDANGVRCAAILQEISRYGIPLDRLGALREWVGTLYDSDDWETAISGKNDVFLSMSWDAVASGSFWQIGIGEPKWDALRKDLSPTKGKLIDGGDFFILPMDITSSIVINLTKIFARLKV